MRGIPAKLAVVMLAGIIIAMCANLPGPRGKFLVAWLEDQAPRWTPASRKATVEALLEAEERSGVDAFLLVAVIEEESGYDGSARSRRGARGLMQLRPATAQSMAEAAGITWSGAQELDDAASNIRLGAAYLAHLKERFESWETALNAYHSGPTRIRRIQRRGGRIPGAYADRVLRRHRRIREAYAAAP